MIIPHDRALQTLRSQNVSVESISYLIGIPSKEILPLWTVIVIQDEAETGLFKTSTA